MKILLVTTPVSRKNVDANPIFLVEPLGLEYVGAGVQGDHEVKLLDLRVDTEPGLKETLETFKPDIMGCGALTAEVNNTKQLCARAKSVSPHILTVVGGQHASLMPGDFCLDTVDIVVMGEGAYTFNKICESHEKQTGFEHIENIYYKKNGKMVFTRKAEYPSLDSLPFPARDLTAHVRRKYQNNLLIQPLPTALVRGSVGCVYRCKFCAVTTLMNHKFYTRSIDQIIEELHTIEEPIVFWVDDEFLLDHRRAAALARAIDKAGIKKNHSFFGRVDTIVNHPECIEEWAKVGLKVILVGFDGYRDQDLKKMKKTTTTSINREAVRILHQNNIQIRGNFILQPDFSKEDFKKHAEYVRNLGVDQPSFSVLTPFPGTELYEETKQDFITTNYDLFDMHHSILPTRLSLKEFYQEFSRVTAESIPFEKKMSLLKQLDPKSRQIVLSTLGNFFHRLENAHLDYQ
jgi:radical SAM superfamily enzyme YgiQ (UPF0313 family)